MEINSYKKLHVSPLLKQMVWDFLNENNIGNRKEANGNKEEQFVGLIGEIMIKEVFNVQHEWSVGFDGGFDFEYKGLKIDVKTMGRNVDIKDFYVNNFIGFQKNFDCDIYIFCSLNKKTNELTICGYETKIELLKKATLYKKGDVRTRSNGTTFEMKADTYEIKNSDLLNISNLFYFIPNY